VSEQVYCVPAERLPSPQPKALALTADLYALLVNEGQFLTRADVEEDPSWRQIIPYAVIQCEGQVLLVERLKAGSESRLHNKMSIGMGGHINPQDHLDDHQKIATKKTIPQTTAPKKTAPEQDVLEAALVRELREELVIGGFAFEATALIHRSENAVEQVHTGLLYLVTVPEPVAVRETHKLEGHFVPLSEVGTHFAQLEGWSQAALQFLQAN
jgi:predicted NUDIX family phosphoesterase